MLSLKFSASIFQCVGWNKLGKRKNIAETLMVNTPTNNIFLFLTVHRGHVLYFPFDTNKDITWMRGNVTIKAPANSLIIGKVSWYFSMLQIFSIQHNYGLLANLAYFAMGKYYNFRLLNNISCKVPQVCLKFWPIYIYKCRKKRTII